ncbi:Sterile alpha motif domain-containing protein 11 [Anabarilius grahami]|uniref:Sterile alpha motif domain-containing protein 11 n=1 Tax=Anabarilius grahami TaxID=495550 RepID=A0A3N0XEF7_ANAGA|nr:Sterile alpha motif domain-containing protein 11 [Anabarilius grahami]
MTPEEHYRRMMSALNEHGSYEEQQQRLYQLANNMGIPSHDECCVCQLLLAIQKLSKACQCFATEALRVRGAEETRSRFHSNTDSEDANLGCDRGRSVNVGGRWLHGCQDVTVWMTGVLVHAAPDDPVLTLLQSCCVCVRKPWLPLEIREEWKPTSPLQAAPPANGANRAFPSTETHSFLSGLITRVAGPQSAAEQEGGSEGEEMMEVVVVGDISHPPPLLSPQNAPHIALGPHLRPPFLGMPSALCQAPGYGFLQPAQAEMFARQQEILRKQNLARLEMSAELLRQKELENLHRQRLLADPLGLHPGLPAEHPALRSLQEIPEGHPLREELNRRNAMLVLRHNNTPLLSLNHQGAAAGTSSKDLSNRKSLRKGGHLRGDQQGGSSETKEMLSEGCARDGETEGQDEDMKDSEIDAEVGEDRPERFSKADGHGLGSEVCQGKDVTKSSETVKELGEGSGRLSAPCSSIGQESPTHHLFTSGLSKSEAKYLPPGIPPLPTLPGQTLPFTFPYTSPYFHTGAMGGLFVDGEEAGAAEDISKWSVEEVCSFINSLAGCGEYTQLCLTHLTTLNVNLSHAQRITKTPPLTAAHHISLQMPSMHELPRGMRVFREQAIDGETLPLLTEDHLLNNMGLKLGPALKIRSQVARRIGRIFYMTSFPLALPLPPSVLRPTDRDPLPAETRPPSTGSTSSPFSVPPPACRASPKQENGNPSSAGAYDSTKPPS